VYLQGGVLGLRFELFADSTPPALLPNGQRQHLSVTVRYLATREEEWIVLVWRRGGRERGREGGGGEQVGGSACLLFLDGMGREAVSFGEEERGGRMRGREGTRKEGR